MTADVLLFLCRRRAARIPKAHMGCGDVMSGSLHGGDNVVALSSVVILQRPTGALLGTGMERVDLVRACGRGERLDQLTSIDPVLRPSKEAEVAGLFRYVPGRSYRSSLSNKQSAALLCLEAWRKDKCARCAGQLDRPVKVLIHICRPPAYTGFCLPDMGTRAP